MFGEAFDIHLLSAFDLHQMADSSGAAHQDSDFFLSPVDVSAKPHRWRLFPDVIPSQELTTMFVILFMCLVLGMTFPGDSRPSTLWFRPMIGSSQ
jgi:hypothetical protein